MYKKNELVYKMNDAKAMHERWMSYAEAMYNGVNIGEEHTPLLHTECNFGKWLQNNAQLLFYINVPKELQDKHKQLHSEYIQIYKLINENSRSSIFNVKKIEANKKSILDKHIHSLKELSLTLLSLLDVTLERINKLTNEEVEKI